MRSRTLWSPIMWLALVYVFVSTSGLARGQTTGIFGVVNVAVKDPQDRPVAQADVTLRARLSSWQAQSQTDTEGRVSFATVAAGEYTVSVVKQGFHTFEQAVVARSGTITTVTCPLQLGALAEKVDVTSTAGAVNAKTVTTESLVTRENRTCRRANQQLEMAPSSCRAHTCPRSTPHPRRSPDLVAGGWGTGA